MSITTDHARTDHGQTDTREVVNARRPSEETKPSWKTTELFVYLAAVIGVLIASNVVGDGANNNGQDYFAADKAWWFITLLTIGYLARLGHVDWPRSEWTGEPHDPAE
jgi:hypothetical protein